MRRSHRLNGRPTVDFDEQDDSEEDIVPKTRKRKASLPSSLPEDKGSDSEEYLVASKAKTRKVTNKSSPSKETSTRRPKKAKTSPTKSSKPPPTNPYTWPASKIPDDATITKGDAKGQYRLRADSDFDGMKCESIPTKEGYIALVYRTRDVERRAWEKHGSPEGFQFYLSKLKERHYKSASNSPQKQMKPFVEPRPHIDKFEAIGKKYDRELASLENEFPRWLWKALVAHLDGLEDEFSALATHLQYVKPRLEKLRIAKKEKLQSNYPARPNDSPPPDSESFEVLENILRCAPSTSMEGFDWDRPPQGIRTHFDGLIGEHFAEWDQGFNDEVNQAVYDVVAEHGKHYKLHALWMVYDAHSRCIGGLEFVDANRYYRSDAGWVDNADQVFKGPLKFN